MKINIAILLITFSAIVKFSSAQFILPVDADTLRQVNLSNLKSDEKTMIALTFGQSNAGNYGKNAYTPHNAFVFNFYNGKLYTAKDPLIGTAGKGGSVWTRLGDQLIDSGLYNKVIFVPIAVGGSAIERWGSGDCFKKLQQTLNILDSLHIRLTHIFWHQGETDNILNTSKAKYKENLAAIFQALQKYQSADFYVSVASYHPVAIAKPLGVDNVIRDAQKEFINENKGVLAGPDTDTLIHAIHRHDSVHFSDFGMSIFAQQWLNAILNKSENFLLN
jgi:hypothetical protein